MTQPTIGNPPEPIVFALPKGRLAKEVAPLLAQVGIEPEPAFSMTRTGACVSKQLIPWLI